MVRTWTVRRVARRLVSLIVVAHLGRAVPAHKGDGQVGRAVKDEPAQCPVDITWRRTPSPSRATDTNWLGRSRVNGAAISKVWRRVMPARSHRTRPAASMGSKVT